MLHAAYRLRAALCILDVGHRWRKHAYIGRSCLAVTKLIMACDLLLQAFVNEWADISLLPRQSNLTNLIATSNLQREDLLQKRRTCEYIYNVMQQYPATAASCDGQSSMPCPLTLQAS